MGVRDLGRIALLMQDSEESQFVRNTIVSRQIFHDPSDAQMLMGQSRVGMLKEKHNRLARKYNFSFYAEEEILSPARFVE